MHIHWRGNGHLTVLGIHGMPQDPDSMWGLLQDVSDEHRIGVAHLPGYGQSPEQDAPYSFDAVQSSLEDACGDGPVILVGMSGGGFRALRMALGGRLDVRALVLVASPTGPANTEERDGFRAFAQLLRTPVDFTSILEARCLAPAEVGRPQAVYVRNWERSTSHSHLALELEAYADEPSLLERADEWTGPTTLLSGTDDAAVPLEAIEALHARLPNSTLHTLPGAGHGLPAFHPETIAAWVAEAVRAVVL